VVRTWRGREEVIDPASAAGMIPHRHSTATVAAATNTAATNTDTTTTHCRIMFSVAAVVTPRLALFASAVTSMRWNAALDSGDSAGTISQSMSQPGGGGPKISELTFAIRLCGVKVPRGVTHSSYQSLKRGQSRGVLAIAHGLVGWLIESIT
jgi:hypothetical protein